MFSSIACRCYFTLCTTNNLFHVSVTQIYFFTQYLNSSYTPIINVPLIPYHRMDFYMYKQLLD
ncbi:hypothetical protein Nmel_014684 [Mimus melanotis]